MKDNCSLLPKGIFTVTVLVLLSLLLTSCASLSRTGVSFTRTPLTAEPDVFEETMQQILISTTAADGTELEGKLWLPPLDEATASTNGLVIFVNGSGPNTYDNTRVLGTTTFIYHELFARYFTERDTAYFSYSTRGTTPAGEGPLFAHVDETVYQTYTPESAAQDIAHWIEVLTAQKELHGVPIVLLGWSEGAIVAPYAVDTYHLPGVTGLVLAGVPVDSMMDIVTWQLTGGSSMVFYSAYFDTDGDGFVSQEEFTADPYGILPALGNPSFASIDLDGNDFLEAADFALMLEEYHSQLSDAIEKGDDAWLKENYSVLLTSGWFASHARIPTNAVLLSHMKIPVRAYQGEMDQNVPVARLREVEADLRSEGVDFSAHYYPGHDHDLNYLQAIMYGQLSQGLQELLDSTWELLVGEDGK